MSSNDQDNSTQASQGGLFKRVMKLVSNPKLGDKPYAADQLSAEEKTQMLIRKQRNDLARRREFEELRQLRRQQAASEEGSRSLLSGDMSSKPSTRQIETLNKINQIENQMASRWAQPPAANLNPGTSAGAGPAATNPALSQVPTEIASDHVKTTPLEGGNVQSSPPPPEVDPTQILATLDASDAAEDQELAELADPLLEEAAVLFASNEDAQVEQNLKALLAKNSPQRNKRGTWLTLMDFYRATGNQVAFESLAMNYMTLFAESAPQWQLFDPSLLKKLQASKSASGSSVYWQSPAELNVEAAQDMQQKFLAAEDKLIRIMDWSGLKQLSVDGVQIVLETLIKLDRAGITLQVTGLATIMMLLAAQTKVNGAEADQFIWQLRLELLRMFDTPEEFDMEAMEYCLAHEISPPAWTKPQCTCEDLDRDPDTDDMDDEVSSTGLGGATTIGASTGFYGQNVGAPLRLRGALKGSLSQELKDFDEKIPAEEGGFLRITCERLVRIDFAAAGDLLNWVSEKAARGYSVQLVKVHRLVALFFAVMGISVSARVLLRKD